MPLFKVCLFLLMRAACMCMHILHMCLTISDIHIYVLLLKIRNWQSEHRFSLCQGLKLTGSDIYIHIYMLLCDRLKLDRFSSCYNNGFPSLVNIRNTAVLLPVTIFFSMLVNIRIQFRFHDACQIQ